MPKRPITDYSFSYKPFGSNKYITIGCDSSNTIVNENGSATIKVPDESISAGDFIVLSRGSFYIESTNDFYPKIGIPRIDISVSNIEDINKETKISGNMVITNAYGSSYVNENLYNGLIKIKTRGNDTSMLPKKPYAITTVLPDGKDNDVPIFSLNKSADWILLAEYYDYSLLRNMTMYDLGNSIKSESWCPTSFSVEVYINSEYQGVYTFVEKVKRSSGRINIPKMSTSDNQEPNITGGYLIEQVYGFQEDLATDTYFTTPQTFDTYLNGFHGDSLHYQRIEYPKFGEITTQQKDYITSYVNDFENALYNIPFGDLGNGYRKYLDINSAVDFYLLKEFSKDVDVPSHSLYYYKQRDGLMFFGSIWDFDAGFGQVNILYPPVYEPEGLWMNTNYWYRVMLTDPYFLDLVKKRYSEIRQAFLLTVNKIQKKYSVLALSKSSERNFAKWNILNTYPYFNTNIPVGNYEGEVERLQNFIEKRIDFLDTVYL